MSYTLKANKVCPNPSLDAPITIQEASGQDYKERTIKETPYLQNSVARKADVATVPTLCKTAELLAVDGQYLKAFHYFRKAIKAGSAEAHFLITGDKVCTIYNKDVKTKKQLDLSQASILDTIILFLRKLQKANPAYSPVTVNSILFDLKRGHCHGLSVFYAQLSLEREDDRDFLHQYTHLLSQIAEWDGTFFEAPQGFNYRQYKAGDKQGLTEIQEKQMAMTDEVKQFFQMFRYAQQHFHEATTWVDPLTLSKMNRSRAPLRSQKNLKGILGQNYKVNPDFKLPATTPALFDMLSRSLCSNLSENNAALLHFPITGELHKHHVVAILYRENRYYLMDSNHKSDEADFDFRYHAIPFETPQALLRSAIQNYLDKPTSQNFELLYVQKKTTKTPYIAQNALKAHEVLIHINQLHALLGHDLFSRAFPLDVDTFKLSAEMVKEISDHGAFGLLSNPQIVEIDCSALRITTANQDTLKTLIQTCPETQIIVHPNDRDTLSNIYFSLGLHYEMSDYSQLIIQDTRTAIAYYTKASELGNYEAKYKLAQLYKNSDPSVQNHAEYKRLLLEMAQLKDDPRVLLEIGYAYETGIYHFEADLYKARDYFSAASSLPAAKSLYISVHIKILVNDKNIKELIQTAAQHRFCDNPSQADKLFALTYLKAAESLGSATASKLIAYMYANKEVPVENPERFLVALRHIDDTVDGKLLLAKAYRFGNILPRDLHKALYWYNQVAETEPARVKRDRASLIEEIEELEKLRQFKPPSLNGKIIY